MDQIQDNWIFSSWCRIKIPLFQLTATSDDTTELVIEVGFETDEAMANTLKEMFISNFDSVAGGLEFYVMLTK
jgi:hypothetical protein